MPSRLATALIAACALVSLWATSASGVQIPIPNVSMVFGSSVTPKKLSRVEPTPIALGIGGRIETVDGSQPPAVKEFVLDLDRHITIDARQLPVCKGGRDIRFPDLKSRCRDSIVGRGEVGVQIQFPEQSAVSSKSKLIVFNAGGQGAGKATLYAIAYLTRPIVTTFPMAIEITRHPHGYRMVIEVPTLANGAGSLTYLHAKLEKRFARDGEVVDLLTGRCPIGRAHV